MLCRVTAGWITCYRRESIFPEYRGGAAHSEVSKSGVWRQSSFISCHRALSKQAPMFKKCGDGICWGCQLFDTGWEKEASQINVCTQRRLTSFFHPARCSFLLWFTAASGNTNTDIPETSAVYVRLPVLHGGYRVQAQLYGKCCFGFFVFSFGWKILLLCFRAQGELNRIKELAQGHRQQTRGRWGNHIVRWSDWENRNALQWRLIEDWRRCVLH